MSARFQSGDVLIVKPKDEDDPDANLRKGQTCVFVRYVTHLSRYCAVQFPDAPKPLYFRVADLERPS